MKPAPFRYERPQSLQEAIELVDAGGKALAGGQSLIAQMAFREVRPPLLVDINGIDDLAYQALPNGDSTSLVLGATCRQNTLAGWKPGDLRWAAVPQAAGAIGNHVVRTRGTVGGSIAHADPAGELPALFLLFDGELSARSVGGERVLPSSGFFIRPHETVLSPGELIREIRLSAPPTGAITGFRELSERAAVAGVGIGLAAADGVCTWSRVVLCGVAPTPLRATAAEQRLLGSALTAKDVKEAARLAAESSSPPTDSHGSTRFRRALVAALATSNVTNIIHQLKANTR
jgi:CO/xanthine dehydrogenase FAD-binding subunit